MKPLGLLAAAFAAWPALADTGAHLHPHGAGAWLPSDARRAASPVPRLCPLEGAPVIPGELFPAEGMITLNEGRAPISMMVANTGDRPIQVGSHYHFAEANAALAFDRDAARGLRLDIAGGHRGAVRARATPRGASDPGRRRPADLRLQSAHHGRSLMPGRIMPAPTMPPCSARPPATRCGWPIPT